MHQLEILMKKNHVFPKRCTIQGIRESHIAQRVIDTECFTLGICEHVTYHIMGNLSSWGMDQLEIFMPKSSFSKKVCLAKH